MANIKIKIIETLEKEIVVDAESIDAALNEVKDKYDRADEDCVLSGDDFLEVVFQVV